MDLLNTTVFASINRRPDDDPNEESSSESDTASDSDSDNDGPMADDDFF